MAVVDPRLVNNPVISCNKIFYVNCSNILVTVICY